MASTHADANKQVLYGVSPLTDHDVYLFRQGPAFSTVRETRRPRDEGKKTSPASTSRCGRQTRAVSVVGGFNGWRPDVHSLQARPDECGIWEGFVPGVIAGAHYKYHLTGERWTGASD